MWHQIREELKTERESSKDQSLPDFAWYPCYTPHPLVALNDLRVHCIILFSSLLKQMKYSGNASTWASSFRWTKNFWRQHPDSEFGKMAAPRVGFLELLLGGPESESSRTLELERQFEKIRGFIRWTCRVGQKDCRPGMGLWLLLESLVRA